MSDDLSGGLIIDLEEARTRLKEGPGFTVKRSGRCGHKRTTVDPDRRLIACDKCGADLDAFDTFLTFVNEFERYRWALDDVIDKVKKAHERLADLKRRESNTRGRIRRLAGKPGGLDIEAMIAKKRDAYWVAIRRADSESEAHQARGAGDAMGELLGALKDNEVNRCGS